ncbi:MAG TPA: response regulator [Polyangiales bacterium]|nr:response regulator [Polyangiales bacterium]
MDTLKASLEDHVDDLELPLPSDNSAAEGEWLFAEFVAEEESTIVPACVQDRGDGLCVCFQERDWQRLLGFADGNGPESSRASHVHLTSGTVLVIDTDSSVLSIVGAMLSSCGLTTETVHSAEEALEHLRRRAYDLIVVEPNLLGMSGIELCRELRKDAAHADVPVLMLASHTTERDVEEVMRAGANDFVGKPFRAHELRARAMILIQSAQATRLARMA